jgi:hypothetical protein
MLLPYYKREAAAVEIHMGTFGAEIKLTKKGVQKG